MKTDTLYTCAEIEQLNCKNCFCQSPVFRYLTDDELKRVTENKRMVYYDAGEVIFKKGTQSTHSISFNQGLAKLYDEQGHQKIILRLVKPTEFISGYGVFFNKTHNYSLTAVTKSSACFVDIKLIMEVMNNNRHFWKAFFAEIQQSNLFIQNRLINLLSKKNPGRIAGALLYLANDIYNSNKFTLELSREQLAALSAVSVDSLSRVLGQFQDGELINMKNKKFKILNPGMLEKIWMNG